jgi:hypothetical protein
MCAGGAAGLIVGGEGAANGAGATGGAGFAATEPRFSAPVPGPTIDFGPGVVRDKFAGFSEPKLVAAPSFDGGRVDRLADCQRLDVFAMRASFSRVSARRLDTGET